MEKLTLEKDFADIDTKPRLEILSVNEPNAKEPGITVGSVDELVQKLKDSKSLVKHYEYVQKSIYLNTQ
ncbi:uncharacterized protein CGFF_05141 [Nakaseomyces glabratus]|nr:uncharacterized protein CGFF_05141 [Nakaseomyces glabratus]